MSRIISMHGRGFRGKRAAVIVLAGDALVLRRGARGTGRLVASVPLTAPDALIQLDEAAAANDLYIKHVYGRQRRDRRLALPERAS